MQNILSLYELNQIIRSVIETSMPHTFLVTAEIASVRCDMKNHCYMDLVDRDKEGIKAESRAVIWASTFRILSVEFKKATGIELSKGIKILFEATVNFHERYGLKLNILNIDPSYTLGEMALKRREILERLSKEGLRDRNKQLTFPLVPQRIGIISSLRAAGYEDLISHLVNNPYDYKFYSKLYEAVMQGERAEASIIKALRQCVRDASNLDVVVIVRGGGGQADLHCFDSYEIAKAIAFLPIPVISGIGHERDITVVDEVSNMRAKTPTAVADIIITRVKEFEDTIDSLNYKLVRGTRKLTSDLREKLSFLTKNLEGSVRKSLIDNSHKLNVFIKGLGYAIKYLQGELERLHARETNLNHLDPKNVLKRGYSITYNNGKAIKSASEVETGDSLLTILYKGEIISKVEDKKMRR